MGVSPVVTHHGARRVQPFLFEIILNPLNNQESWGTSTYTAATAFITHRLLGNIR